MANANLTILASVLLFLQVLTNILATAAMAVNLAANAAVFSRGSAMFWWGVAYRIILNSLAMYTTWTLVAALVNLPTALVYPGGRDVTASCIAALSLLVIFHSTWFILENFVFDKYARFPSHLLLWQILHLCRYILTPYLVIMWASYGIHTKQVEEDTAPQVRGQSSAPPASSPSTDPKKLCAGHPGHRQRHHAPQAGHHHLQGVQVRVCHVLSCVMFGGMFDAILYQEWTGRGSA